MIAQHWAILNVTIRASLTAEPDQSISFVGFGPRLIISQETLKASGLQNEGAFISYKTRLRIQDPARMSEIETALREQVEGSYIRLRTLNSAGAGFERFVERAELFLMLVGLNRLINRRARRQRGGARLAVKPDECDRYLKMSWCLLSADFPCLHFTGSGDCQPGGECWRGDCRALAFSGSQFFCCLCKCPIDD